MAASSKVELPPKYYLDYFTYVLNFVGEHYQHLLDEEEDRFLNDFRGLSEEAQCGYVRAANRAGVHLRYTKFNYPEITDLPASLHELEMKGFISYDLTHSLELVDDLLRIFTKAELLGSFRPFLALEPRATPSRQELDEQIKEELPFYIIADGLTQIDQVFRQERIVALERIKLLFFGHMDGDMAQFVVRDVGHGKFERFDENTFQPFFQSRKDIEDVFHLATSYRQYKHMVELVPLDQVVIWYWERQWSRAHLSEKSWKYFDKISLKLAKALEQQGRPEEALAIYRQTPASPSCERQVRLLTKLQKKEEALSLCEWLCENPINAEERIFAEDFLAKNGTDRIVRSTTLFINNAEKLELSQTGDRVEQMVLQHYQAQGYEGSFTENYLWRGLFGLVFWEVLFSNDFGSIHHPLQRAPSDLYDATFFPTRRSSLEKEVQIMLEHENYFAVLVERYHKKEGMLNPFVGWHEGLLPLVERSFRYLGPVVMGKILLEIARNPRENTRGFPDLFVWKDNDYHFIEVKSPNDHLSAQQLFWLKFLNDLEVRAKILRLVWA